jgi:hypothetical protein
MADARGTWEITVGTTALVSYADAVQMGTADGLVEVQTEKPFRATEIVNYERGNFSRSQNFTVTKEFATNAASVNFYLKAPQLYGGVKTVVLKHISHAGSETEYTLTGCYVRLSVNEPVGVTVEFQVNLLGGIITGGT